jgi:hydroxymethylbilane synthase
MRLVIASRKSDLARIQSLQVGKALQKQHPGLTVDYHWRESLGDVNLSDPLWKMPEKGVFTEDFRKGLLSGEFDVVVHSWKDLPTESRHDTVISATLPREDVRDLLLFKKKDLGKKNITLLSSSPRRIYNLQRNLPSLLPAGVQSLDFKTVRGNVQTRVRKMLEDAEVSGLIVAKAALDRLLSDQLEAEFQDTRLFLRKALENLLWMVLPVSLNPTAAAQGALAIEIRKDRKDLQELLLGINCTETYETVQKERALLAGWGGGCHQKIGVTVLKRPYGEITCAQGLHDAGASIDLWELASPTPTTFSKNSYFPNTTQEALWFDRKFITPSVDFKKYNAHWVSKAEALPKDIKISTEHLLWTSGVRTWQRLAARGLWVHGSSESLGEREDLRLQMLDTSTTRNWCKWTHEGGEANEEMDLIKTYILQSKAQKPQLSEDTEHFFWMSGSSFREALKHYPWLAHKSHWSGPGLTSEAVAREIAVHKGRGAVHIALNFEKWQKLWQR